MLLYQTRYNIARPDPLCVQGTLQANYDIRTILQLLGHSDVRTTIIYTHTVKSVTLKEIKSPLDF